MENGSTHSSTGDRAWIKEMELKEKNVRLEDLEGVILEKDRRFAFLETSKSPKEPADFESKNHELLVTRGQMVNGLDKRSEAQDFYAFKLPQSKWEEERLVLMNQISSLHKKLQLVEIEKSVKNSSSSDSCNSNGFSSPLHSGQKVENGGGTDVQRKNWAGKKFPGDQTFTVTGRSEESSTTVATANIAEGHVAGELCTPKHITAETMDNILVSPLKNMSKDELISHYIRVVAEMRREKEILLAEKTEEIYRLKKNFLREKGIIDKEVAMLKKKLVEVTMKLDEAVKDNENLSVSQRTENKNHKIVFKRTDELQSEKRILPKLIPDKESDLKTSADKFGETTVKDVQHASREAQLLKQIAELESEREDIGIRNGFDMDILRTLLEETIKEKTIALNLALKERWELEKQKHFLEDMIQDKDRVLNLASTEKEVEKKQIALMGKRLEEKENELEKLKESLHLALKEGDELKKQNDGLENVILGKNIALDSLTKKQEELKKQVVLMEETIKENEHVCNVMLRNLEDARKEKAMLERHIQDKKNIFDCFVEEEEKKRKQLEATIAERENALVLAGIDIEKHIKEIILLKESLKQKEFSLEVACRAKEEEGQQKHLLEAQVKKLKDTIRNMQMDLEMDQMKYKKEASMCIGNIMGASFKFEHAVLEKLQHNFLRLEGAERQLIMLCRRTNAFMLRGLYYKELYQRKCCNLQKAEEEVDLLGDEVDSLLSLLEKVYMILDHYAPILQHYPGILDLVKLIKKEIMGHLHLELKL